MQTNRRELLARSGALATAALAGCLDDGGTPTGTSDEDGSDTPTVTETETQSGPPAIDEERLAELAAGNAAFALDLHARLAGEAGGNLFISPYSISAALAMTYAGARGETREQMERTLQYTLGEDVHSGFGDLRTALAARETTVDPRSDETVDAFQLDSANALWGREDYGFAEAYLDFLGTHYDAGLRRADFADDPDGERERINEWVAETTEDRIDELLPRGSITAQTVLVLTNAIYFMASWSQQFDPGDTEDDTFTALDGTESTVPFMHQHLRTNYAAVDGAKAIELPYVGEDVSMVFLLPEAREFEAFEQTLDADRLFAILGEMSEAAGDLAVPKFAFETEVQLRNPLAALGMSLPFTSDADFGGMVENGDGPFISEVYHDAFVTIDEEGTEAAAATAVVMDESAPPEWGELRVDRPFLFCIRDRPTDAVLFLGRVVDAGGAQATH